MSRQPLILKPYQQAAVEAMVGLSSTDPAKGGMFIDMGLGKTAATLCAIKYLLTEYPADHPDSLRGVLIVGPKRVVEHTWPSEISKWDLTEGTTYQVASGTPTQRREALNTPAHIHLISRDNLQWMTDVLKPGEWRWDLVVLDELTSFKNHQSKRFRCLRKALPKIKRCIGLTGTPVPNGLKNLWPQMYLIDRGKTLGTSVTAFHSRYFRQSPFTTFPDLVPLENAREQITDVIRPSVVAMRSEDYLQLPRVNQIEVASPVPPALLKQYNQLKRDMVLQLTGGAATQDALQQMAPSLIKALSGAALVGKLLQVCGGSVYDEEHKVHYVHDIKLQAMDVLVESAAAEGRNLLVYYAYTSEKEALLERYAPQGACCINEGPNTLDEWNKGQIPLLLAHPASAGHGLNLQDGGSTVVWFNLTYDLELFTQANKRLHRMGQERPVTIYVLTLEGLIDSQILNQVLAGKAHIQETLLKELSDPVVYAKPGAIIGQ